MKTLIAFTLAAGLLAGCSTVQTGADWLAGKLDAADAWAQAQLEGSYVEAAFTSAFGLVYLGELNERLCTDKLDGEWVQKADGSWVCNVEDWPF